MSKLASKQLKDLLALKEQGFNVPLPAIQLLEMQDWKDREVTQVWECKKCQWKYESFVELEGISCARGHSAEKIYP